MMEKYLDLLYRSFDAPLSPKEQEELNGALETYEQLRREKEKVSEMRRAIAESSVRQFRPYFINRVMAGINGLKTMEDIWFESFLSVFRPVAVTAIMLLIVILTYNFNTNETISVNAVLSTPAVTIEDAFDPFAALSVEK
jgi:hypothetical protein